MRAVEFAAQFTGNRQGHRSTARIAILIDAIRHSLGSNLQFLDEKVHHEAVCLMENQIIHVIDGLFGFSQQLLDAAGHLADGKIEHIHAVHEDFKVVTDISVFTLLFHTRLRSNRIAHTGVNLEDIASPACFEIEDRLDMLGYELKLHSDKPESQPETSEDDDEIVEEPEPAVEAETEEPETEVQE